MRTTRCWRVVVVGAALGVIALLAHAPWALAGRAILAAVPEERASPDATRGDAPRHEVFRVVVNERNEVTALSRTRISRFFLKKAPRWDSGAVALPVDLPADSPVRDAFTKQVLAKSVSSVKAYWQQQIFSGREVPPPEKPDDTAVLEFVLENPAAIAYVSSSAALPHGVRALVVTD